MPDFENLLTGFINASDVTMSFSSSFEIYETQYKVEISPDEYNYSMNPTLISGSDGAVYDFVTGSFFSPYVTSIGLYDNSNNLLAVAKLSKPIPLSNNTSTTFLVNIDR